MTWSSDLFRRARGFTVIELIVVLLVLGVLASLAVVGNARFTERALDVQAQANLAQIATAVMAQGTADQVPELTRELFHAALSENSGVELTDGIGATAWRLGYFDQTPQGPDDFAVGFDRHDGVAANDGGSRAVVMTSTGSRTWARVIVWRGSSSGSEPQATPSGAVPSGSTPGDVLADPSIIVNPGSGQVPGSGGSAALFCPALTPVVTWAPNGESYAVWLNTTEVPDGYDWSGLRVASTHYAASDPATPLEVDPDVYASPSGWTHHVLCTGGAGSTGLVPGDIYALKITGPGLFDGGCQAGFTMPLAADIHLTPPGWSPSNVFVTSSKAWSPANITVTVTQAPTYQVGGPLTVSVSLAGTCKDVYGGDPVNASVAVVYKNSAGQYAGGEGASASWILGNGCAQGVRTGTATISVQGSVNWYNDSSWRFDHIEVFSQYNSRLDPRIMWYPSGHPAR